VFQVIDRVCRYEALLAYEDQDGNLVLAQAGSGQMASGFQCPGNVEAASVSFSMDELFSDYYVLWTSTDTDSQVRQATNGQFGSLHGHATDPMVPRFRPRAIVSEQMANGIDLGQQRATWEANRRRGRSQAVTLTCDFWRDSAGALWQPNALAPVDISICKISNQSWLIAEVVYRRGEDGTHADLTLMPAAAFQPEPTGSQGEWQVQQALQSGSSNVGQPGSGSAPDITST
jgi:prophage tail gpP-like protein